MQIRNANQEDAPVEGRTNPLGKEDAPRYESQQYDSLLKTGELQK